MSVDSLNSSFSVPVLALSGTSCSLSIVGGGLIFATYAAIPEIRNYSRRLLLYLTVADVLSAAGYLLSVVRYSIQEIYPERDVSGCQDNDDPLCGIQSFVTTFSSIASFFWTVIIASHILATVIFNTNHSERQLWLWLSHFIGWFFPGIIAVTAAGYGVLGKGNKPRVGTGPWCCIKTDEAQHMMWMLVTGKGWEVACYIITASFYILVMFHLFLRHRHVSLHDVNTKLRDEDRNFLYVWLILYLLRVWGTIRFFLYISPADPSQTYVTIETLLCLQAVGDPGQAFANFLLFCVADKTVRGRLCDVFRFRCNRHVYEEIDNADNVRQSGSYHSYDVLRSQENSHLTDTDSPVADNVQYGATS